MKKGKFLETNRKYNMQLDQQKINAAQLSHDTVKKYINDLEDKNDLTDINSELDNQIFNINKHIYSMKKELLEIGDKIQKAPEFYVKEHKKFSFLLSAIRKFEKEIDFLNIHL